MIVYISIGKQTTASTIIMNLTTSQSEFTSKTKHNVKPTSKNANNEKNKRNEKEVKRIFYKINKGKYEEDNTKVGQTK